MAMRPSSSASRPSSSGAACTTSWNENSSESASRPRNETTRRSEGVNGPAWSSMESLITGAIYQTSWWCQQRAAARRARPGRW
ncbi:hypothetical protein BE21_09520 [Sorangium cellulosum]|uniref:Uncharacterized protein n=1 Tax=Sorangium cellulosum TaxID=56 RepID=A0A150U1V2_SORCE|nr:hypothetical protein BE21_09520 [Sorangium cellulosum]